MKNNSHHIEVSHEHGFERYIIYTEVTNSTPLGVAKLVTDPDLDLDADVRQIRMDIINHILKCDFETNIDSIYYIKASLIYTDPADSYSVHINETNDVVFNIPMNLMYTAVCSKSCLMEFTLDSTVWPRIVLERRHSQICINYDSVYMIGTYTDILTLNEMTPRCVQFVHGAMLIRNSSFLNNLNNGNLTLAYADIYHNNLDDDIIYINDPSSKIASIHYDQFTGVATDNTIEVCFTSKDEKPRYFQSNKLDNELVELLTQCMITRLRDLEK